MVGEALLDSAPITRSTFATGSQRVFMGRNYVLPSTGQEGIPVVTVNTSRVDVEVYRIGDRNLLPTVRSDDFLGQMTRYSAAEIARDKGMKIWNGTLHTSSWIFIRDVITAFPVSDAVGKLEPGVDAMTAKPSDVAITFGTFVVAGRTIAGLCRHHIDTGLELADRVAHRKSRDHVAIEVRARVERAVPDLHALVASDFGRGITGHLTEEIVRTHGRQKIAITDAIHLNVDTRGVHGDDGNALLSRARQDVVASRETRRGARSRT